MLTDASEGKNTNMKRYQSDKYFPGNNKYQNEPVSIY